MEEKKIERIFNGENLIPPWTYIWSIQIFVFGFHACKSIPPQINFMCFHGELNILINDVRCIILIFNGKSDGWFYLYVLFIFFNLFPPSMGST